ncbi:MAG TPA: fatty acid CoA ligase family protein [Planctomycetaceae bacterium]|nr:fatty acid CoA ligase family protein [Planctomycetaceae bacterium]
MSQPEVLNIASTLRETARRFPSQSAIVCPGGRDRFGRPADSSFSFDELDRESDLLAHGLADLGVEKGQRLVLMVRPGVEFIALTFALFKAGAVVVLIDPGMGPRRVFRCLDEVEPEGFIAIPPVHALRIMSLRRFRSARLNVTVGRRWFWKGATYDFLLAAGRGQAGGRRGPFPLVETGQTDPAAIIFTSGSTGPSKGVVYEHGMFAAQVEALRDFFNVEPGGIDLPGLPLFALFNSAMGVTTVIPQMDPAHPARVDPAKIVAAIHSHKVTQAFGSPAIWNRVGRYCEARDIKFPTLQRIFSAGAPVPIDVLARMKRTLVAAGSEMHTPYGATEALPVASITATDVLTRTAARTREGAGTCVGRPIPGMRLKIIEMIDGPIPSLAQARELPAGEIGEIIVQGAVVTREYFRRPEATAAAKISDGERFWHRMGDVGYLDESGELWFCGRKGHVVETLEGRMFTDCVEPIFNSHPALARCALVGLGARPRQTPCIVVELESGTSSRRVIAELRDLAQTHVNTRRIERFLIYPRSLPVDVRHNTKIDREQLAAWARRHS